MDRRTGRSASIVLVGLVAVACGRYGYNPAVGDGDGGDDGAGDVDGGGASADGDGGASADGDGGTSPGGDGTNPPKPAISVTPAAGTLDTVFQGDAAGTRDDNDPPDELLYEWDFNGDGSFDATGILAEHTYASVGDYKVVLRVTNSDGLRAYIQVEVSVVDDDDLIVVTTGIDEEDENATPEDPGGTGLSLREAMLYTNQRAGHQTILVPEGTSVALEQTLPDITDPAGVTLIGYGATVDGSAITGGLACFSLSPTGARIFGLEITGCPGHPINLHGGSDNQVAYCHIHGNARRVLWHGADNQFGPDNRLLGQGIQLDGDNELIHNTILGIDDIAVLIAGGASGSLLAGNRVIGNATGIQINANVQNVRLWNNTVHGNSEAGVVSAENVSGLELRNTSVSANGLGVQASDANFAVLDHSNFFENSDGDCSSCSIDGNLQADPRYVDPAGDFRLRPDSDLIDQGIDLGLNLNGSAPGLFYGAAPDIGGRESW